jgi:hypothetical protein
MKPNGKHFAVRAVLFVVCAVSLLSAAGNAETARGTFKLPVEARWGSLLLAPGEYEFTVDIDSTDRMVTVLSKDSGGSGMVMSVSLSDPTTETGPGLKLAKSPEGLYVQTLYLGDSGMALNFTAPKATRLTRLTKASPATTMASASGTH